MGLSSDQTSILGNGATGIFLVDSSNITLGEPGAGSNVVSGTSFDGIVLLGSSGVRIDENRIGGMVRGKRISGWSTS